MDAIARVYFRDPDGPAAYRLVHEVRPLPDVAAPVLAPADDLALCERPYRLCQNGVDHPSWKPGTYADPAGALLGERSMMVGDVVVVGDRAYAVAVAGFRAITARSAGLAAMEDTGTDVRALYRVADAILALRREWTADPIENRWVEAYNRGVDEAHRLAHAALALANGRAS